MPVSDQQAAELLGGIRERLRTLEEEISRKLGDSADELTAFDRVGDDSDLSQAVLNSEIDLSEATRDIDEWRRLRGALRRFDEGSYGVCIDCGVDIPLERLRAQPAALRCIACQTRAEQAAGEKTPSL